MPRWAMYLIGAVIAALVAMLLAPVFPAPLSTVVYWLAWVVALILVIMAIMALVGHAGGRGRAGARY